MYLRIGGVLRAIVAKTRRKSHTYRLRLRQVLYENQAMRGGSDSFMP